MDEGYGGREVNSYFDVCLRFSDDISGNATELEIIR